MSSGTWSHRPLPALSPSAARLGSWRPMRSVDLTAARQQLTEIVVQGARHVGQGAVELLALAFEELASNALRHGVLPIEATVTLTGGAWLLAVSDAAGTSPPAPAVDRDPALGGLGLHLVARISIDRGWCTGSDGRKTVWARIAIAPDESLGPKTGGSAGPAQP